MAGHGHVVPNPDGTRARCGGPGACPQCSQEYAREHMKKEKQYDPPPRAPFEVRLTVTGDTWTDALRILQETVDEIVSHGPECSSTGGSPGGSHSVDIQTRAVAIERYHMELHAWRERRRA